MKIKKILSGALASALLVTAMPVFSAFADEVDDSKGGSSMLTAEEIAFNGIISSNLTDWDTDWYKFTVPSAGKVNISLGLTGSSLYFTLKNGNDEATTLYEEKYLSSGVYTYYLTAGDYYIDLSMPRLSSCNYDMQIKYTSSDLSVENENNNTLKKATAVECDGTDYVRQFSLNDAVDYYSFELAEKGRVTLNFDSDMDNTDWELYDSEDALIKNGTFRKGELDSGISAKEANIMKPGKYTVAFKKNTNYGTYSFSLDYLKNYNDISVSGIIAAADLNEDGSIDSSDASLILTYYAYISTGGTETDMNKWLAQNSNK